MKVNEYQSSEKPIDRSSEFHDWSAVKDILGKLYDLTVYEEIFKSFEEETPMEEIDTVESYVNKFAEWQKTRKDGIEPKKITEKYEQIKEEMGAVVTSQPSAVPGDASGPTTVGSSFGDGGIVGSGDIGVALNRNIAPRPVKSRRKKRIKSAIKKMNLGKKTKNLYTKGMYKQGGEKGSFVMPFSDFVKKKKKK